MRKQKFVITSVILSLLFLLIGCKNNKQNYNSIETTETSTVKVGIYNGEQYKLTSSFIPSLILRYGNKFKLELGISKSIEGTYTIDNNKLVLTSSNGDESYLFDISNNVLIIENEIPKYVRENTNFKLFEAE